MSDQNTVENNNALNAEITEVKKPSKVKKIVTNSINKVKANKKAALGIGLTVLAATGTVVMLSAKKKSNTNKPTSDIKDVTPEEGQFYAEATDEDELKALAEIEAYLDNDNDDISEEAPVEAATVEEE